MAESNQLLPGDWRRSIRGVLREAVEKVMQKRARGYRLFDHELNVAELVELLDQYDRAYVNRTVRTESDAFAKSPKNKRLADEALQPAMGGGGQLPNEVEAHLSPAGD